MLDLPRYRKLRHLAHVRGLPVATCLRMLLVDLCQHPPAQPWPALPPTRGTPNGPLITLDFRDDAAAILIRATAQAHGESFAAFARAALDRLLDPALASVAAVHAPNMENPYVH